jgi:prolyl oligopeptidase
MRRTFLLFTVVSLLTTLLIAADKPFAYPQPPKSDQTDDYFGTKVADPYRDLENLDSAATKKWIAAENKLTFDYLAAIPERKKIKDKMTALWNYEKFTVPYHEGGRYFFSRNTGLQNQNVVFTSDRLPDAGKVLIDPNTLSKDGTVALAGTDITEDGKLMAYGLEVAGSDWQQWKVRDIATGKDLSDDVQWVKFSNGSWKKDGTGFSTAAMTRRPRPTSSRRPITFTNFTSTSSAIPRQRMCWFTSGRTIRIGTSPAP